MSRLARSFSTRLAPAAIWAAASLPPVPKCRRARMRVPERMFCDSLCASRSRRELSRPTLGFSEPVLLRVWEEIENRGHHTDYTVTPEFESPTPIPFPIAVAVNSFLRHGASTLITYLQSNHIQVKLLSLIGSLINQFRP